MNLKAIILKDLHWILLAQDRNQWQVPGNTAVNREILHDVDNVLATKLILLNLYPVRLAIGVKIDHSV
jgi:hypothetical protein